MSVRITSTSTSDYGYLHPSSSISIASASSAMTMCGWFKIKTWSNYNPMLAITPAVTSRAGSFELYTNGAAASPDGPIWAIGGSSMSEGAFSIATEDWIFIAFTRPSGATSFTDAFYCGDEASSDLTQYTSQSSTIDTTWLELVVGALADVDLVTPFNGEVAHVRLFTAQLSESALRTERDSTTPVASNCYLSWPMNDATDTSDQSGNNRIWAGVTAGSGTITNGASNPPPGPATGGPEPLSLRFVRSNIRLN